MLIPIVGRKHDVFRSVLLTNSFNKLLVNGGSLDYIRHYISTHHIDGIHIARII